MKKIFTALFALFAFTSVSYADQALIIDAGYSNVTQNVKGRLEAAGHTVTVTSDVSLIPTSTGSYQQVWDLRYSAALTSGEQTKYQSFITGGGFAYFVTENPGCCMARNNSVAALVTALGGGSTQIGPGWANNVETNMNTTYMTNGITVNYAAVAAIVNSQGIPLISDGSGAVSGMSWIGRAGALGSGVTGTIITVADTNWLDSSRFVVGGTTAQQQNVQALDDIIRGVVAGTVAGTISSSGNGAGATNGNSGGGSPPPPTVVSSAAGTPITSSTTTYGNATVTNVIADARTNSGKNIVITRTTTPITTTPYTLTTTTTPTTVDTYSDGSTVTTNGTPVVSTAHGDIITVGQSSSESDRVSAVGMKDLIAYRNFNPFLVDALSIKDGTWATPNLGYAKLGGNIRSTGASMGYQKTVDNNSFGFALRYEEGSGHNYINTKSDQSAYAGTAYFLTRQEHVWVKTSIGWIGSNYSSTTSLSSFNLSNSNRVKQNNVYGDLTIYSAKDFNGFRPLFGATVQNSNINSVQESGSALLSTAPVKGSTNEIRPYAGVRYDLNDWLGAETRITHSQDFKTVSQNRVNVKKSITNNAYIELGTGFDRGSNYTAGTVSAGLKVSF